MKRRKIMTTVLSLSVIASMMAGTVPIYAAEVSADDVAEDEQTGDTADEPEAEEETGSSEMDFLAATDDDTGDVYVTMNIPYYDFYDAVDSGAAQAPEYTDNQDDIDAYSYATEKYGLDTDNDGNLTGIGSRRTSGTAKGTYNDGYLVKGVFYPVKMDAEDYEALQDSGLGVGDDYYFDDLDEVPASYLTVDYADEKYSFSADGLTVAATEDADIGEFWYTQNYGDYEFELMNVDNGLLHQEINTTNIDGEACTIAGEILQFSDGSSFALYNVDNIWMGTRYNHEISWSVPEGRQLTKGHNHSTAPRVCQYEMSSYTITGIEVITEKGIYEFTCGEDGYKILPYLNGTEGYDADINDGDDFVTVTYPDVLEDVKVSVYYSVTSGRSSTAVYVAKDVTPDADGVVQLTEAVNCAENGSYTACIESANYAPIEVTLEAPMTDAQRSTLEDLIAQGKALLEQVDHSLLAEHVEEAEELLADPDATSSEAAELIEELETYIAEAQKELPADPDTGSGNNGSGNNGSGTGTTATKGAAVGTTVTAGSSATKAKYKVTSKTAVTYNKTSVSGTTAKVPATVTINGKSYKVTKIAANAFKGKKKLTKVTIGKNVTTIGKKAFLNCTKLKTVTFKTTKLKSIGAQAFKGDKKLTKLTLKSTKMTKKGAKNALKGSSVKTVKTTSKLKAKYKKYFTKKNCGKAVKVK